MKRSANIAELQSTQKLLQKALRKVKELETESKEPDYHRQIVEALVNDGKISFPNALTEYALIEFLRREVPLESLDVCVGPYVNMHAWTITVQQLGYWEHPNRILYYVAEAGPRSFVSNLETLAPFKSPRLSTEDFIPSFLAYLEQHKDDRDAGLYTDILEYLMWHVFGLAVGGELKLPQFDADFNATE